MLEVGDKVIVKPMSKEFLSGKTFEKSYTRYVGKQYVVKGIAVARKVKFYSIGNGNAKLGYNEWHWTGAMRKPYYFTEECLQKVNCNKDIKFIKKGDKECMQ